MTSFDQTLWADSRFAQEYRENADHFIPQRHELFRVLRTFYRGFAATGHPRRVCDLGCGDGVITQQLLEEDPSIEAVLVDGSAEMLDAARLRVGSLDRVEFKRQSFADWMEGAGGGAAPFDFIVSGFAIHHLRLPEKAALFEAARARLRVGGWFMNVDTVFPNEPLFTDWYYALWQDWVDRHDRAFALQGRFAGIAEKARRNPDNQLSPLEVQLELLRAAGLQRAECHYKNGLFVVFGGQRVC